MSNIHLNNKGITLVESLIAVFLTAIAIVGLMPMQDMALRTASRSDYLGRAAGIMQTELEAQEAFIMTRNPLTPPTLGTTTKTMKVSDIAGVQGDATYTVTTTINQITASQNRWSGIVHVRVTWTGNANGVRSSIIAMTQDGFQPPKLP